MDRTGSSGAGYLLPRYERDRNFFQNLNGMFHGLIVDRARGVVTVFNDRYSMHRLCYHEAGNTFTSVVRQRRFWLRVPNCSSINQRSLGEFVSLSCVLENRTIFKDVQVFPAAFRLGIQERCTDGTNPHTSSRGSGKIRLHSRRSRFMTNCVRL